VRKKRFEKGEGRREVKDVLKGKSKRTSNSRARLFEAF